MNGLYCSLNMTMNADFMLSAGMKRIFHSATAAKSEWFCDDKSDLALPLDHWRLLSLEDLTRLWLH